MAVPVAPLETVARLKLEADDVVCLMTLDVFAEQDLMSPMSSCRNDLYIGGCEALVQAASEGDRPPIIKEDFERPPIRDPAENKETFAENSGQRRWSRCVYNELACRDAQCQDGNSDKKFTATFPNKLAQFPAGTSNAVLEIISNCLSHRQGRLGSGFLPWNLYHNFETHAARRVLGPFDDETFGLRVQIPLSERRWIKGIE